MDNDGHVKYMFGCIMSCAHWKEPLRRVHQMPCKILAVELSNSQSLVGETSATTPQQSILEGHGNWGRTNDTKYIEIEIIIIYNNVFPIFLPAETKFCRKANDLLTFPSCKDTEQQKLWYIYIYTLLNPMRCTMLSHICAPRRRMKLYDLSHVPQGQPNWLFLIYCRIQAVKWYKTKHLHTTQVLCFVLDLHWGHHCDTGTLCCP